jgi:capsule polysaccharide export protein KpsE/RkpR
MAKAKKNTEIVEKKVFTLEDLTKEELEVRYNANVAERKRLAEENKFLIELHRTAVSTSKKSSAEAKIAALQAKLEALRNPSTPEIAAVPESVIDAIETESLAG